MGTFWNGRRIRRRKGLSGWGSGAVEKDRVAGGEYGECIDGVSSYGLLRCMYYDSGRLSLLRLCIQWMKPST